MVFGGSLALAKHRQVSVAIKRLQTTSARYRQSRDEMGLSVAADDFELDPLECVPICGEAKLAPRKGLGLLPSPSPDRS